MNLTGTGLDLPPELRARLRDLRFSTARDAPVGPLGRQESRSRGSGLEFAQYRGYVAGDSPRQIDWKLFARSDRLFVRESERDSPLCVYLVLDCSASMAQEDAARPGWTRLHAARRLAACALEIALREDERFGLLAFGANTPLWLGAGAGRGHRDRCLAALGSLETGGQWPPRAALDGFAARIERGALVLVLSDGFEPAAHEFAARLAASGRSVAMLRVLTAEEREFPFRGALLLVDPETGERREVDAARVREAFLQRFGAARAELARQLASSGVALAEHWLDAPEDEVLRELFGAPRGGAR
jgi:uncharacterized protein (DUF58 family)